MQGHRPPNRWGPLFTTAEADRRVSCRMREAIAEIEGALKALGRKSPWSPEHQGERRFPRSSLSRLLRRLDLPNLMAKKNFYELADHVPEGEIDPEIREKLDGIAQVAQSVETTLENSGGKP